MQLPLSNIINISVAAEGAGLSEYNTSNVALFTSEATENADLIADGYAIYREPNQVGIDFGTGSRCYSMALAIFSQQPNILANGGYLAILLLQPEQQHIAFSGTVASGVFKLNFDGDVTADINWNDTASQVQAKVRTLTGLEEAVVTGSFAAGFDVTFDGYEDGDAPMLTSSANTLATSVPAAIVITITEAEAGETLAAAIARTKNIVQYFGIMKTALVGQVEMLAAAAVVQALNKMIFFASNDDASIETGGQLDLLRSGGFTKSRGLFYDGDGLELTCLNYQAAYAGRGLSVNFAGSNTTINMHLKDLRTIQPDDQMSQTKLEKAKAAGADIYCSFQGVAKIFTSGTNKFFDQVYNLGWFVGALEIAGFNYLAQTPTKIPQTEAGVDGLDGVYRKVCQQGVANGYLAPGQWNSPTTFGNQADLLLNIAQVGYYVWHMPIALQSQADREDRKAPLTQIAVKEAGGINSADVLVFVNA